MMLAYMYNQRSSRRAPTSFRLRTSLPEYLTRRVFAAFALIVAGTSHAAITRNTISIQGGRVGQLRLIG